MLLNTHNRIGSVAKYNIETDITSHKYINYKLVKPRAD